jgi:hypothetical protein
MQLDAMLGYKWILGFITNETGGFASNLWHQWEALINLAGLFLVDIP